MCRKLVWLIILAVGSVASVAHAAPEAVPTATMYPVLEVNRLDSVVPAPLDLVRLGQEDAERDRQGLPPRFAVPERVSITPAEHGTWEDLGNGKMLWRLRIMGREGTTSLNLGFTRFRMSERGRLLLYSTDGSQVARPFTAADNEAHGELWTPVVLTDDLIVELTVPKREARAVELKLGWINQGYRGFGTIPAGDYTKSGSCNLDVACLATGDTWREEMRAVAVISTGGSLFCTGSLLNNTAGNRKMYFITANHCGVTSSNAASLVAYWNYQNSFCRAPGSAASGSAGNGQLNQFHTGSFFRASYAPSDVTLVELDDPPVASYNHHWAGWDRSTGNPTCSASVPCAAIHHPSTHEKRITYATTNMATTSWNSPASPGDGTHLWVHWATDPPGPYTVPGVTEPGSSGSPLYNSAGRFVGQLHGGPSACGATGDNLSDYYGRFSVSWTGGGTSSTRLSSWLDAGNTGATAIGGIDGASFEGYLDIANCRNIYGWAWDQNQPNTAINVDIYRDGAYRTTVPADTFRQDLLNAGKGNGYHGFNYVPDSSWKDGQWHSAGVRFPGTSTNLTWSPRNVICRVPVFTTQTPAEYIDTLGKRWSVGNDFSSSISGYVTHLRYYRAAEETGIHTLKLFTLNGVELGSRTFDFGSDLTAGWETSPAFPGAGIQIQAGVAYTVTVTTTGPRQSKTACGFGGAPITNGPITATGGRWVEGDGIFPTNGSCSNFWTDIYFDQ